MHEILLSFYSIAAVPVNFVQKVSFAKSKHEIGLCMPIPLKICFKIAHSIYALYFYIETSVVDLIRYTKDVNIYSDCILFLISGRRKKYLQRYLIFVDRKLVLTLTLPCKYGSLFRNRLPKFLGHATAKSLRPRRDSNSQSSDSKSDALSIRPRGLSNTFGQNRT